VAQAQNEEDVMAITQEQRAKLAAGLMRMLELQEKQATLVRAAISLLTQAEWHPRSQGEPEPKPDDKVERELAAFEGRPWLKDIVREKHLQNMERGRNICPLDEAARPPPQLAAPFLKSQRRARGTPLQPGNTRAAPIVHAFHSSCRITPCHHREEVESVSRSDG
jgi:hypothetical protein